MAQQITLSICHLYPNLMDTYGDKGNIITLVKRCEWRGIKTTVSHISTGDAINKDFDFFFFGGGQDRQQEIVAKDLKSKAKTLKIAVENNSVLLSICGGYQLLQKYFRTQDGKVIEGIGIFDAYTIGSNRRMIGNLLVEIDQDLRSVIDSNYKSIVSGQMSNVHLIGFENHSGKTYLGKNIRPLGKVIRGAGNNGEDKTEGAIYKNAVGCYLHGSLLPKNPHFADYLISKALERKYGHVKLKPLDDSIEWQTHTSAVSCTKSHKYPDVHS